MSDIDYSKYVVYDERSVTNLRWVSEYRKGKGGKLVKRINPHQAGSITKGGHLTITIEGKPRRVADVVWSLFHGKVGGGVVMYKDSDHLNSKIDNLFISRNLDNEYRYGEFLGTYLEYDETSPSCLRWKVGLSPNSRVSAGGVAGGKDELGYWNINSLGKGKKKVHKIVWALHNNFENQDGKHIDHINGDPSDNRIENLRLVCRDHNARNKRKHKNSKTGVTGVIRYDRENVWGTRVYGYTSTVRVEGKNRTKNFSSRKYGDELAFLAATEWRDKMITILNLAGAGYTDRHGTNKRGGDIKL